MAWTTPPEGMRWEPLFEAASVEYGLPAGLLSRVAWQESRYNPSAYNPDSTASGMMQIVPRWHPGIAYFDPEEAIPYAASYLRQLYDEFGNWPLALAAYNAGPSRVKQYGGIPPFAETVAYVSGIVRDVFGATDATQLVWLAIVMVPVVVYLVRKHHPQR